MLEGSGDPLRKLALQVLWEYYGKPYRWGGDDPGEGVDCSGLVIEVLQSVGIFPRNRDATAEGLRRMYRLSGIEESDCQPGDLVFWMSRDGDRAIHVEMVVVNDREGGPMCMGASGGGSWATNEKIAWEKNAFVKVRPARSRSGQRVFIDPFAPPVEED